MLPRKYKQRYDALLDENTMLSRDATGFSEMVKGLNKETRLFSDELLAQEQYYSSLINSTGLDPGLVEPHEEQLLEVVMELSELAKTLRECINAASSVVCRITDNFSAVLEDGRRLEKRSMKSRERDELLTRLEKDFHRLKMQYFRSKLDIMQKQEELGRLKLIGMLGVN